jgi:hypothetical protein
LGKITIYCYVWLPVWFVPVPSFMRVRDLVCPSKTDSTAWLVSTCFCPFVWMVTNLTLENGPGHSLAVLLIELSVRYQRLRAKTKQHVDLPENCWKTPKSTSFSSFSSL